MTKAKPRTTDARRKRKAAGGEALRQRVTELWNRWDDEFKNGLEKPPKGETEGPFTNLDVLVLVSEKNFPDGRQLGKESWEQLLKAQKFEKSIKQQLETSTGRSELSRLSKGLSAYGAARELAGYRAAQLEMLVAYHAANKKASEKGNEAKAKNVDQRVRLLADFVRDASLAMHKPVTVARIPGCRDRVNQKIRALAMLSDKQFERDMVTCASVARQALDLSDVSAS